MESVQKETNALLFEFQDVTSSYNIKIVNARGSLQNFYNENETIKSKISFLSFWYNWTKLVDSRATSKCVYENKTNVD